MFVYIVLKNPFLWFLVTATAYVQGSPIKNNPIKILYFRKCHMNLSQTFTNCMRVFTPYILQISSKQLTQFNRYSSLKFKVHFFQVNMYLSIKYIHLLDNLPDRALQLMHDGPWGHQTISPNINPSSLFFWNAPNFV